jgi:exodeoxyribonuclease-3
MAIAMKLASWNVNGLRACLGKGFLESALSLEADIICLQETKMERGQADAGLGGHGYMDYWNSAQKKGYSGTAVFTRVEPLSVSNGIGMPEHDTEGRVIRMEFERFTLVNAYVPNSRDGLARLPYRMSWEDDFRAFLAEASREKPVVLCGDLNVAHQEIDIKNAKPNRRNAGFTDEERGKMTELLDAGFADAFRRMRPEARDAYTWWSYFGRAREKNVGWRIDYFIVSERLMPGVIDASIHPSIYGSDHCPVSLTLIK